MRIFDSIRRSGRSLRHAKLRTILTMLAISIGAFALALTLAAGEGARLFVDRLVSSNFNPQSILVFPQPEEGGGDDSPFATSEAPKEYNPDTQQDQNTQPLTQADLQKIAAIQGVDRVAPAVSAEVSYATGPNGKKYEAQVSSIDQGVTYEALAGTLPAALRNDQAVLPEAFVEVFGFTSPQEAVSKQIVVHYTAGQRGGEPHIRSYQVVGVAKKPNGLLGGARNIVLAQKELEDIYAKQSPTPKPLYYSAIVFAESDNKIVLGQIKAQIASLGFGSLGARELATQITQAVNIVQYFVAGFGLIALLVSIFGIVNTQLISVLERTREIGLMKALGLSGGGVLGLFVLEAAWIGFGGAAIGIFAAYVAGIFVNPFLSNKLQFGGDLLVFLPLQAGLLVAALMVIAALAGLLPAWKAARLNPITALRTE